MTPLPTTLPPKPGHSLVFLMPQDMTTRAVNALITATTEAVIEKMNATDRVLTDNVADAEPNRDYRTRRVIGSRTVPAHYIHGVGHFLRDTFVARYTPSTRQVEIHYPPNYWGDEHPTTTDWTRMRVAIWDAQMFALGGPKGAGGRVLSVT